MRKSADNSTASAVSAEPWEEIEDAWESLCSISMSNKDDNRKDFPTMIDNFIKEYGNVSIGLSRRKKLEWESILSKRAGWDRKPK